MKQGDKVTFTGWCIEQVRWGGCDPPDMLTEGETYVIESVNMRSSHTKVTLVGYEGRFNSVHFELNA